jgi:hypothetical protein
MRQGLATRFALLVVSAVLIAISAPISAEADVVFEKGADIWVMEDDGTDARALVKGSDLSDMDGGLADPHVDPVGKTVVFTGNTARNKVVDYGTCGYYPYTYPCWTWHYGFNATGVYKLEDGAVTRVSGAPAYCYNCTMSDYSPELSAGAKRHAYSFMHCQGTRSAGSYACNSSLGVRGEGEGSFGTVCGPDDAVLYDPTINPANANQIAYSDCTVASGENSVEAIYVAEPGRANEHPVACDDSTIEDPSFSPSGNRLVTSEKGTTPGLWIYDPTVNNCLPGASGTQALVNPDPDNISFSDPRFMGSDKLVFAVGTKSGESWVYDLYTIAAGCNGCQFPSAATKLTEGGESSSPAWTSAALAVAPVTPPDNNGGGNNGGGGGNGGGDGGGGDNGGGGEDRPADPTDIVLSALTVSPAKFKATSSGGSVAAAPKGAQVAYRLSGAARVGFRVQRKARRRACRRDCVLWKGAGGFRHAGVAGLNGFKFTGRIGGRKLSPGKYRLVAAITDKTGAGALTAPFKIVL